MCKLVVGIFVVRRDCGRVNISSWKALADVEMIASSLMILLLVVTGLKDPASKGKLVLTSIVLLTGTN